MASITSNQNNSFVFKGWGYGTMFLARPFLRVTLFAVYCDGELGLEFFTKTMNVTV